MTVNGTANVNVVVNVNVIINVNAVVNVDVVVNVHGHGHGQQGDTHPDFST